MIQFAKAINPRLGGEGLKSGMQIVVMRQRAMWTQRELHCSLFVEERYPDKSSWSYCFYLILMRHLAHKLGCILLLMVLMVKLKTNSSKGRWSNGWFNWCPMFTIIWISYVKLSWKFYKKGGWSCYMDVQVSEGIDFSDENARTVVSFVVCWEIWTFLYNIFQIFLEHSYSIFFLPTTILDYHIKNLR